eukprot:TRINITY_DN5025_c0_g2_i2.p1 TRINITY_DN5025_c0_g2~~TRINITY_DN5025_c0_g2_i2.p1  ORF type:complete len:208 (-),score=19.74 TRINITY_DN5025_c0_g2_i2:4-627(-)
MNFFKRVVSLSMSPVDETFLSAGLDHEIRLWDLRSNACQGLLRRTGRPVVSFDPAGIIFAVAHDTNTIKLYDIRTFDKAPFSTFQLDYPAIEWRTLKFSYHGKYLLASTNKNIIFLLDAFDGTRIQEYTSFSNKDGLALEACFSPDAHYVSSGSDDGTIHIWETSTGKEVTVLDGQSSPVTSLSWNPKMMMIASGATHLAFWIPLDE